MRAPHATTVAVTGASGLVGTALTRHLRAEGREVLPLVRSRDIMGRGAASGPLHREGVYWRPSEGEIDAEALEGVDAVVHLAGENLAAGRWTRARKRRILDSRVEGTDLVARTIAGLERPPSVLVCASGVNYYGGRGDAVLDESASAGEGFLADVCSKWEQAADPARDAGIRVVHLRTGIVLSAEGGALAKMLPIFKKGLGGRLGSGQQYMSWIALDDMVRVIATAIDDEQLEGPVNAVSPSPVTNVTFTDTLGRVLGKPARIPVPKTALELALGKEMAQQTLLVGLRVQPRKLEERGFEWRHAELEDALRHALQGD